ncbi:MAG: iron ABC transporter permease [Clostridiales bacterium]|nr:iron ABC transporter permease [Clostridiales bacterium]
MSNSKYATLMLGITILLALMVMAALCLGRYSMNPLDVWKVLVAKLSGETPPDEAMHNILFLVRIPRVAASLLIGAALSLSGAIYQSIFRNPLISPDFIGVSSGASVGASAAIVMGLSLQSVQLFAFTGGVLAVLLAASIPKLMRNSSNLMLVLSGIIVSGFMDAIIGILRFTSRESDQLAAIVFWQMGSLAKLDKGQLFSISPPILAALILMIALSWRINILSFGEQEAKTLGLNVARLRALAILCASLMTACAVCVSGKIGWIGLIIPHFGRLIGGSDNTKLMPLTALLGGAFMLLIDTLARNLTAAEIPLSILTGLMSAPFFVWLLSRNRLKVL